MSLSKNLEKKIINFLGHFSVFYGMNHKFSAFFLWFENVLVQALQSINGATKSHFAHYSCWVIILFNTGLCRSTSSTISFGKLVFRVSVLSMFFVLNQMFWISLCYLLCYLILLCNRRVTRNFFRAWEFSWN